ncbi:FAD synthase [Candidatus Uhrbacteria bacterium]|nr:FAD synthase [Candidatus Uhrbacteria bacterium]
MSTVLVFGVFDGIHPGHLAFLRQAKRLGDTLVVSVARDTVVEQEKGQRPRIAEGDRRRLVASLRIVDRAVLGDPPNRYTQIFRRIRPTVVAIGYDQHCAPEVFRAQLAAMRLPNTKIIRLRPYRGTSYHTSQLRTCLHGFSPRDRQPRKAAGAQ